MINIHAVSCNIDGSHVTIHLPPRKPLTKQEALEFAAWIVAIAHVVDDGEGRDTRGRFLQTLSDVENT